MRTSVLTSLATALLAIAFAVTASAQPAQPTGKPAQPTAKQLEDAKKHFTAAETAKARGDFKTAAVEYLAAYEQFQDPEFFFNVAEVYRLGNDEENALAYYQKYLQLDPNGRGAAAARTAVDALTLSIAAKQDAAKHEAEAAAAAEAKRKADEEAKRKADEQAKLEQAQQQQPPPEEPAPQRPGGTLRIAGLATAGAGVVAIGVGVVFGLRAKSISNEAAQWDTFDQARFDQGEAAERNMFIFTGVGGAALITGGVLYYLGHRAGATTADSGTVTVAPVITPETVTFTAAGRF
jgi:tetratricopeptide (TPR) repeat protein